MSEPPERAALRRREMRLQHREGELAAREARLDERARQMDGAFRIPQFPQPEAMRRVRETLSRSHQLLERVNAGLDRDGGGMGAEDAAIRREVRASERARRRELTEASGDVEKLRRAVDRMRVAFADVDAGLTELPAAQSRGIPRHLELHRRLQDLIVANGEVRELAFRIHRDVVRPPISQAAPPR